MKKVLVLLSTYNGERFLRKQLLSLLNQEGVDIHILVRDDGSTDSTKHILSQFNAHYDKLTIIEGRNVGPAMSFYLLLKSAWENYKEYEYFAFSDQDDEWDSDKLSCAVEALDTSKKPFKLYYCRFRVINGDGEVIEKCSPSVQYPDYKNCLFRNPAPGCSQVFSKGLLERAVDIFKYIESPEFDKSYLHLHDVWTIHLACYLDALIYVDTTPHFSYRQHSSNVTIYSEKSYIKRFKTVSKDLRRIPNKYSHAAQVLFELESINLTEEKRKFLRKVSSYKKNLIKTVSFALSYPLYHELLYVRAYAFYAIIRRLF